MTLDLRFRPGILLFHLLACSLSSLGQEAGGSGVVGTSGLPGAFRQSDQKPHVVGGQVVNSVTGQPIYRALVQIGTQFATLTDREGRFELEDVTTAGMPPSASKPGYSADIQFQPNYSGAPEQMGKESVIVKLVPEAILSGTVTGPDQNPLEGVQVQLKALIVVDGIQNWTHRQQTTTNSEGQFRFADLEAGKYAVVTGIRMEGVPDEQSSMAYMPVRYPEASTLSSAITILPGQHIDVNLISSIEKLFSVTGTVSGYDEISGVNFNAGTTGTEEISTPAQFDPRTGRFRMDLPSGTLQVKATVYLPSGSKQARLTLTVPGAPVHGVAIALEPSATIPVEVEAETANQPVAEGAVAGPPSVDLNLLNADPLSVPRSLTATALSQGDSTTNGAGARMFANVAPGRYRMQAIPKAPWYVLSATCGGLDLMRDELVIGESAAACSIRVSLRNDSGSVHISIKKTDTGKAPAPAVVYLLPLDNLTASSLTLWGSERQLNADGLAPGRYVVMALDHPEELAYRDLEALLRYSKLGQEITVTANGKTDIEVSLMTGGALE